MPRSAASVATATVLALASMRCGFEIAAEAPGEGAPTTSSQSVDASPDAPRPRPTFEEALAVCDRWVRAHRSYSARCEGWDIPDYSFFAAEPVVCAYQYASAGATGDLAVLEREAEHLETRCSYPESSALPPGSLAVGQGCLAAWQCASGLCAKADGALATCGTCTDDPTRVLCSAFGGCLGRGPFYCKADDAGPGHCAQVKPLGSKCGSDQECGEGGYCVGTCKARRAIGEACTASNQCISERCGERHVCTEPAWASLYRGVDAVGGACSDEVGCARDLYCKAGACARLARLGEDCDDSRPCLVRLTCDKATKKCVPPRLVKAGEPCDLQTPPDEALGECTTAHNCMLTTENPELAQTCPLALPLGARCLRDASVSEHCGWGATCLDGTCQVPDPNRCVTPR